MPQFVASKATHIQYYMQVVSVKVQGACMHSVDTIAESTHACLLAVDVLGCQQLGDRPNKTRHENETYFEDFSNFMDHYRDALGTVIDDGGGDGKPTFCKVRHIMCLFSSCMSLQIRQHERAEELGKTGFVEIHET